MSHAEELMPTVMVVEDFDDARWMLRKFLESGGCRVVEAANGRDAIEVARREHPDLVLMDLNMPVLDGFSATLRFRADERLSALPIVAVTAYDTLESRAAAQSVGCDAYLPKPVDFAQLTALLDRLLPPSAARLKTAAESG